MPKLSVIIPVYNSEKYLEMCISSVLNQSFQDLELILVDDGSTDSSAFLCDAWKEKDNRVKVVHKQNQGQGIARNNGIKIATGEFVAFIDSDDYIEKEMYKTLLDSSENIDLVLCQIKRVFENGKSIIINDVDCVIYDNNELIQKNLIYPLIGVLSNAEKQVNCSSCRGVYKRQLIIDNNLFFESERTYLSEDLLFNINYFSFCSKIKCLNVPFYCYRDNHSSFSTSYTADKLWRIENLYKKALELLGNNNPEFVSRLSATILGHISVCVKQVIANKNILGHKKANELLKQIVNSNLTQNALQSCKYLKLQAPLNVFCFLIDKKLLWLLKILVLIFLKLNVRK